MEYNHFEYGEMLAMKLKAIQHSEKSPRYFRAIENNDPVELEEQISAISPGHILVAIDGSNSDYSWGSDNLAERSQYFFLVLQNTNSDRIDTIYKAQQECKAIVQQIISRLMYDSRSEAYGLYDLDSSSFVVRGVGPLIDNLYGVLLGFNLNMHLDFTLNSNDWL